LNKKQERGKLGFLGRKSRGSCRKRKQPVKGKKVLGGRRSTFDRQTRKRKVLKFSIGKRKGFH